MVRGGLPGGEDLRTKHGCEGNTAASLTLRLKCDKKILKPISWIPDHLIPSCILHSHQALWRCFETLWMGIFWLRNNAVFSRTKHSEDAACSCCSWTLDGPGFGLHPSIYISVHKIPNIGLMSWSKFISIPPYNSLPVIFLIIFNLAHPICSSVIVSEEKKNKIKHV